MNAIAKAERSAHEAATATSAVEGEIRDVVRRDHAMRRCSDSAEVNADHFNSLIERVAGTSLKEIDNLIAELQSVRNFLKTEGERVQRELTSYARATEAALSSVKIITESMGQWKNSAGASSRIARS
jgi:chromosome segregation ATPase